MAGQELMTIQLSSALLHFLDKEGSKSLHLLARSPYLLVDLTMNHGVFANFCVPLTVNLECALIVHVRPNTTTIIRKQKTHLGTRRARSLNLAMKVYKIICLEDLFLAFPSLSNPRSPNVLAKRSACVAWTPHAWVKDREFRHRLLIERIYLSVLFTCDSPLGLHRSLLCLVTSSVSATALYPVLEQGMW